MREAHADVQGGSQDYWRGGVERPPERTSARDGRWEGDCFCSKAVHTQDTTDVVARLPSIATTKTMKHPRGNDGSGTGHAYSPGFG